ncbi:MAG: hypothetical protein ACPGJV_06175 [Bacteriovoracaceae bacterium]
MNHDDKNFKNILRSKLKEELLSKDFDQKFWNEFDRKFPITHTAPSFFQSSYISFASVLFIALLGGLFFHQAMNIDGQLEKRISYQELMEDYEFISFLEEQEFENFDELSELIGTIDENS